MDAQRLITEACEQIGDESVTVRSYSGRGMYGKTCTAIVGSMTDCQRVIAEVLKEAAQSVFDVAIGAESDEDRNAAYELNDEFSPLVEKLVNFSWDSMGYADVVVYWPRLEWVEPPAEELPTDLELDTMPLDELIPLLRNDWADYLDHDTDDLTIANIRKTAKIVRDRVKEDMPD